MPNSKPTSRAKFEHFKEEDEITKLHEVILLRKSIVKILLLVVPLSIITLLFFLLFLWWFVKLRKALFYSEVTDVRRATHIFVLGGPRKESSNF